MDKRIKELRNVLGLTQQAFADRLGTSRGNIACYEIGKNTPSDAAVTLICKEFNVREEWLRNGTGEMFIELDREQEIASMTAMLFKEEENSFKYRLINALCKLDENGWEVLEQLAKEIANKKD